MISLHVRIFAIWVFWVLVIPTADAAANAPQSMNPDIGVSILSLYRHARRSGSSEPMPDSGASLQEVELQLAADVDPYFRATTLLSVHPEEKSPALPGATESGSAPPDQKYAIEPEEAFVETTSLPGVIFKIGRFYPALGRHNTLHAHAFPFIDAPLINQRLLGADGYADVGISAAVLLPLPWFSELTVQGLQGNAPDLFAAQGTSALAQVYRWRHLVELSDAATLDVGMSGGVGPNFYNGRTTVRGGDFSLKWRPSKGGKYHAFAWSGEYLQGAVDRRPEDSSLVGFATWMQVQVGERWWLQGRGEAVGTVAGGSGRQTKYSGLIGFTPTEFSGVRLQVDRWFDRQERAVNSLALQGVFTIGAHPAHSY